MKVKINEISDIVMNFHGNKLSDTRNLLQMLTKSTSPSYLPRSWPWSRAEYISVTSSLKLGHCKQLRSLAFRTVPEPSHTLGRTRNKRRVAVQGLSSEVPLFWGCELLLSAFGAPPARLWQLLRLPLAEPRGCTSSHIPPWH